MNESYITKQVDTYCKARGIMYIGKNDNYNHARSAGDGYPDRIIFLPNRIVLCIEFKTPEKMKAKGNSLRPKQKEWQDYLLKCGHLYYLLDDAKIAITIIESYIDGKDYHRNNWADHGDGWAVK